MLCINTCFPVSAWMWKSSDNFRSSVETNADPLGARGSDLDLEIALLDYFGNAEGLSGLVLAHIDSQ